RRADDLGHRRQLHALVDVVEIARLAHRESPGLAADDRVDFDRDLLAALIRVGALDSYEHGNAARAPALEDVAHAILPGEHIAGTNLLEPLDLEAAEKLPLEAQRRKDDALV